MCKSWGKHKRKEIELKLKQYEILYIAYADEIRNLWQRSIFLGAFMTLAWGGYGALQLKFIEKWNSDFNANFYNYASLGLCAVIIVLSLLWVAMAKGSKFVQEAHEAHIAKYNELDFLFCNLDDYQRGCYDTDKMQYTEYPTTKPLKPYRYSPSKINIFLGWLSGIISSILGFMHIIMAHIAHGKFECLNTMLHYINWATDYAWLDIVAFFIFIVACMGLILHKADEQNDTDIKNKQIKEKGAKNG